MIFQNSESKEMILQTEKENEIEGEIKIHREITKSMEKEGRLMVPGAGYRN